MKKNAQIIQEVVDHGLEILQWEIDYKDRSEYDVLVEYHLRQILDYLQAVSVLISHSSIDPSKPILKSALKAFLQLDSIFAIKERDHRKSMMVWNIRKELEYWEKLRVDISTNAEIAEIIFRNEIKNKEDKDSILASINECILRLKALLEKPDYLRFIEQDDKLSLEESEVNKWEEYMSNDKMLFLLAQKVKRAHRNREILITGLLNSCTENFHFLHSASEFAGIKTTQSPPTRVRIVSDAQRVAHYALLLGLMTHHEMIQGPIFMKRKAHVEWKSKRLESFTKLLNCVNDKVWKYQWG